MVTPIVELSKPLSKKAVEEAFHSQAKSILFWVQTVALFTAYRLCRPNEPHLNIHETIFGAILTMYLLLDSSIVKMTISASNLGREMTNAGAGRLCR